MTFSASDRVVLWLRWLLVAAMAAGALYYVVLSVRWPLMCDSPIMHYVVFLMRHGHEPYRTITDNNMPGAYLSEAAAMRIFGPGDVGWRVYEFFLLGTMTAAMAWVSRGVDWVAGLFAGGFFVLQHGAEGPVAANEREQVTTALFLLGYVLLFAAVRRRQPWWMAAFGLVSGLAITIKPLSLLLCTAVLVLALGVLQRRGVSPWRYMGAALAGFAVALACSLLFLLQHHALAAFWFVLHRITPSYVALAHPSFANMLRQLLPRDVRWFVLLIGVPAALLNRNRWSWERWALTAGCAAGLATYFLQQKGFNHHRYTFEILLLLLIGWDLLQDLRQSGLPRWVGAAGLLITVAYFVPSYVRAMRTVAPNSDFTLTLEADLNRLGGPAQLQQRVMCFDMVYGCLDALYHLGLVENNGFTGDLLLFFPEQGAASVYYRDLYQQGERRNPPDVLVISNEWLQRPNTFSKLATWPAFEADLRRNYTLVATREFPMEARTTPPPPPKPGNDAYRAYRIYLRKGTELEQDGPRLLGTQP